MSICELIYMHYLDSIKDERNNECLTIDAAHIAIFEEKLKGERVEKETTDEHSW